MPSRQETQETAAHVGRSKKNQPVSGSDAGNAAPSKQGTSLAAASFIEEKEDLDNLIVFSLRDQEVIKKSTAEPFHTTD